MNIDLVQLAYYAGFALLGWWLRHQGLLKTPATPIAPPVPAAPTDQKALVEFLKTLLDRLLQAPAPLPENPAATTVFHVPVEVAATAKNPRQAASP